METQNSDGGGGTITPTGTAASMCAISPSDLVGTIGNLISRIESLEKIVSNVLGANLHAQTLGDLSDQVGWVYGIEYMGVPGWIQTEYGTLIPPPGFTLLGSGITLSDGNTYTAVYYDANGVLQFGFPADGSTPTGVLPDLWNIAGNNATPDCFLYRRGANMTTGTPYTFSRNTSLTTSSGLPTDGNWDMLVTVSQAGLYQVDVSSAWGCSITGNAGAVDTSSEITGYEYAGASTHRGKSLSSAINQITHLDDVDVYGGSGTAATSNSIILDMPANGAIYCAANIDLTFGAANTGRINLNVSIVRIGTGSM